MPQRCQDVAPCMLCEELVLTLSDLAAKSEDNAMSSGLSETREFGDFYATAVRKSQISKQALESK